MDKFHPHLVDLVPIDLIHLILDYIMSRKCHEMISSLNVIGIHDFEISENEIYSRSLRDSEISIGIIKREKSMWAYYHKNNKFIGGVTFNISEDRVRIYDGHGTLIIIVN